MEKYILASASPRRKELLEQIGMKFKIMISDSDEEKINKNLPTELYVEELAMLKATECVNVLQDVKDTIVIAADTIVYHDGKILGKPKDKADAFNMLSNLSENIHQVYTGICVMRASDGFSVADYEKTDVHFNKLSSQTIQKYIDSGEPMDKAGAYGIQGLGAVLVDKICGDYFNVVGLPLSKLSKILSKDFGIKIL